MTPTKPKAQPRSLWRTEGGVGRLALHKGQQDAWKSDARFTFIIAGTQSGKTSFIPWWLWREIQRGGPGDYLAVTATFDLFKLKMLPELRQVFEHTLQIGRYWSGDRLIELRDPDTGKFWAKRSDDLMWGRIILRSAEAGGGLESTTAKAAALDECGQDSYTLETWEAVLRRVALSRGRVLGATTPYNTGWLKSEVYDRWAGGDRDFAVFQFPSLFNPLFDRDEYERAKRTMPPHRFAMFYNGEFGRPLGLIYDCYDDTLRTGHLVGDFPIPKEWPRFVGIDFGAVNTALVWVAEDPHTGRFYIYRESLGGSQSTGEHVKAALALAAEENVCGWFGGAPSETQQRMDWGAAGIFVDTPWIPDVAGGIDRPYSLFRERRLYVFESCRGVRDELGSYRFKVDPKTQQVTDEIQNKRHFHRLDGLRYVAPALGAPAVSYGPSLYS